MYKIYTAQITRFGSPAIVITTAYTNAGGYFKAESFCVFPPPHTENIFQALRFDKKSFDESPIELNEAFMFEEALAQARIDIGLHIEKHYSEKSFLIPTGELNISESSISLLIHLQVRQSAAFLADIKEKTDCEALREVINSVLALPPISRREL